MTKIVQCPSCNTKFALSDSQLKGVENPKFQCSRCQTVFNLEPDPPPAEIEPSPESIEEEESPVEKDPLEGFSLDVSKFTLGSTPSITQGTQMDFGFDSPPIHREEKQDPEIKPDTGSQRDAPTKVSKRLDGDTLEDVVYAESGSTENPIAVGWEEDTENEEYTADYRKNRETLDTHLETKRQRQGTGELSDIFRSGSQRSSTGSHALPNIPLVHEPEENNPPTWTELKNRMELQDHEGEEQGLALTDSPLQDHTPIPNDPINSSGDQDSVNRSMKHTTVMQRDALDVEGFLKPFEDHDIEEESPLIKKIISPSALNIKHIISSAFSSIGTLFKQKDTISPFTKSVLIAWSIPICLLIFLFTWSQTLSNKENLNSFEAAIADSVSLFTPPNLILPPVNLVLNSLSAELRPDKSGDPMIIISGMIFNAGLESAKNPVLEARTYDKTNTLVKTLQAPVPNELSRFASSVNLTELEKEEILKLQTTRSWDTIIPSNTMPFKVVVTEIGQGYKYFSAKIYSVSEIS